MRLFWDSLGGDKLLSLDQWTPLQCLPPSVLPLSQPNLQATIIMSLVPIASGLCYPLAFKMEVGLVTSGFPQSSQLFGGGYGS